MIRLKILHVINQEEISRFNSSQLCLWVLVSPTNRQHFSAIIIHKQFQLLLEELSFIDEEKLNYIQRG